MENVEKEILSAVIRWHSYGWEWRVIRRLMVSQYGAPIKKAHFLELIKGSHDFLPEKKKESAVVETKSAS